MLRNSGAPIAVIGMACRLPGADSPEALWNLLDNGTDATGALPRDRFAGDSNSGTRGGFLDEVDAFDADFFGITDDEAALIDPQQRLLLTTAWEALEDAGTLPGSLAGTRTAVYAGQSHGDHWDRLRDAGAEDRLDPLGSLAGTQQRSLLAGRISYAFGLHGPSVTVDTGQASSLTAVHLACLSLRAGEAALALAGGANTVLAPAAGRLFGRAGVLAPDGRCKFADASANGFVRSDGVGMVVLKPLDRALADGDRVRAVLLGSAVGNDGATKERLTDPSRTGQRLAMRWAYEDAGVSPGDVDYVEAHGTGTRIDAVELGALNEVLGEGRPAGRPVLVGSLKTNIGHCEAAAGVAGLIKTVLCLEHRAVPASLHLKEPSPLVDWDRLPLVVPTTTRPLPPRRPGRPHLAAVNGQSISGVNVHVVLASAPESISESAPEAVPDGPWPLVLSAPTADQLAALVRAYLAHLAPDGPGRRDHARDICWTSATRRTRHHHTLTVRGDSHAALHRALAEWCTRPTESAPEPEAAAFAAAPGRVVTLPPHPWRGGRHSLLTATG
ncbi:beta-ketoacyl synthase N-terminal-like domain-containing protein [Streptomyces sp. NPDC002054]|uniref:beta-ketoacyl synthase N-terminal-like domain-containing protein n=1 Tax=Streptomyces sp. NPDC002054 TaxID=3154663 RepID=UPI0033343E0D